MKSATVTDHPTDQGVICTWWRDDGTEFNRVHCVNLTDATEDAYANGYTIVKERPPTEVEKLQKDLDRVASQMLFVMQLDLGYSESYTPLYNRDPIRHQLAWDYAVEAIGGADKIRWIDDEQRARAPGVKCLTDEYAPTAPETKP